MQKIPCGRIDIRFRCRSRRRQRVQNVSLAGVAHLFSEKAAQSLGSGHAKAHDFLSRLGRKSLERFHDERTNVIDKHLDRYAPTAARLVDFFGGIGVCEVGADGAYRYAAVVRKRVGQRQKAVVFIAYGRNTVTARNKLTGMAQACARGGFRDERVFGLQFLGVNTARRRRRESVSCSGRRRSLW